jgi:tRNA(fMet)-specific endonuclease VapC
MFLLDTDHITLMDRGGQEGQNILARLAALSADQVTASIISYEEQMRGWLAAINSMRAVDRQIEGYQRLERTLEFYCSMALLPFDAKAAEQFQRLWLTRIRIGTMDLKIAAIALANNRTLLSRNISDFGKVPGLHVEDWSAEPSTNGE